ncbi:MULTISPECIES: uracil-DNA glycosylase [Psychrilyobacter]|uniref:uracil-DNA glycosylase n=1 Tax=Psychrilyobacter piezotolerans TaxID=2293438 RepID=A0ABX9KGV6_9FUSO|nr:MULTISPECIES: uracil-DNA glycosylase [Psychrilyobacter]MCS5423164.1 uracil-DNA glycosylase [Psychrilyobacter sp. S5]NDI78791.1 uracil-DNA glycosylase [Psychrilyobacter piezotolerans]RDE60890.1 uracil-DNA glycosylase [Psychrilyobacter sp. S5]REI40679.1 uracil-DNA glycosylase [Psychrilyobacter piezotolerans]
MNLDRNKFLEDNKIHDSYHEFFTLEIIHEIEGIMGTISNYTPPKKDIFKVFRDDLSRVRVVLLAMDPYPQEGVATGLAFEVEKDSWMDKGVNTSLKNMVKLIYKTYIGEIPAIDRLRSEIKDKTFEILPPNELFKSWESQGVLLLNTALTVEIGKSGSHIKLWENFTEKLIGFLERKNNNLIFLLWGAKAGKYKKYIERSQIIEHNHPAICGNLKNQKDFLNGESFEKTREIIDWTGKITT